MVNETVYEEALQTQLRIANDRISKALLSIEQISSQDIDHILGTYKIAVEPNFIPWMHIAYESSASDIAKEVILENIKDEIQGDHPKMLRDFIASAGVLTQHSHYHAAKQPVLDMWKLFGNGNGLMHVASAAALENTSATFIPYLAHIARIHGCTNFKYTDVHGEADIVHAEKLNQGTLEEMQYANAPIKTMGSAIRRTTDFLESVLTVSK